MILYFCYLGVTNNLLKVLRDCICMYASHMYGGGTVTEMGIGSRRVGIIGGSGVISHVCWELRLGILEEQ